MVVRGREFIINTMVFGRDRNGRVGLVERVHNYLKGGEVKGRVRPA